MSGAGVGADEQPYDALASPRKRQAPPTVPITDARSESDSVGADSDLTPNLEGADVNADDHESGNKNCVESNKIVSAPKQTQTQIQPKRMDNKKSKEVEEDKKESDPENPKKCAERTLGDGSQVEVSINTNDGDGRVHVHAHRNDNDASLFSPARLSLANTLESTRLESDNKGADTSQKRTRMAFELDQEGVDHDDAMSLVESDGDGDDRKMDIDDPQVQAGDSGSDSDMMSVDTFNFDGSDGESLGEIEEIQTHDAEANPISKRFDADLVVQSIERGEVTLEKIKKRDCVLIVGKTGTGKSTLIQAIAGKKMQMRQMEVEQETEPELGLRYSSTYYSDRKDDGTRKRVVYEAIDPLPGFEIGHGKKSKTTTIGCYDHASKKPNQKCTEGKSSSKIMFVDSPGFEDTNGHEIDVATSILLSQVATRCRSLRFVIMISFVSLLECRGDAMRSVLRLIRTFAKNFDEEKQSFMFLFTHSNEIKGVPDTIDGAKSSLLGEINGIINGTEDEDTKEVLNFIAKSLKKNFPFVNVFLPLQTDATELIRTIQTKLKPIKDPHIASNCSLTLPSQLSLGGELQCRLQEVRRDLSSANPPMNDICAAFKLFQYFNRYVGIQDTRDIMQEAECMLEAFVKRQKEMLQEGMKRGTNTDHDFGDADTADMKGAFARLQILQEKYPNHINCHAIQTNLKERLEEFHKSLMIGTGEKFSRMHRNLLKLSVWSRNFTEHARLYENVQNHLVALIQQSIDSCNELDSNDFYKMSHEQLKRHVENLAVLNSIRDDEEYLAPHGLDTQRVSNVYGSAIKHMRSDVKLLKKQVCKIFKKSEIDEHKLRELGNLSVSFEDLKGLLEQFPICQDLKNSVIDFRQRLACDLTEHFGTVVSGLSFDGTEQPESIKDILHQTKLAAELFSGTGDGLSRQISIIYETIVDKTKSLLMKRLGEIKQITQDVTKQGIKDDMENAMMLHSLRAMCWFDSFLPDDETFVENNRVAFERAFHDRIECVKSEAKNVLVRIADDRCDSELPAKTMKPVFLELRQISVFAKEMEIDGVEIEVQTRKELLRVVTLFIDKYRDCVAEWKHLLMEDVDGTMARINVVTGQLERVLRERKSLLSLDPQCDSELGQLFSRIKKASRKISSNMIGIMEASGEYKEKYRLLQIIHSVAKHSSVSQYMPKVEDLKDRARNAVASDAKKIEDLVSQTSEWDKIDSLLDRFQDATILDDFICNEATSRITPLLKLREQKQEEVDNLLDQMITGEDFKGIGDFLLPYAKSKDQVKTQKFEKWLCKISSTLSETIASVLRNLDGDMSKSICKSIVSDLLKLEQARKPLQQYLRKAPGALNLSKEIGILKREVNNKFQCLLEEFGSAIKNLDFEVMGIKTHFIDAHSFLIDESYIHDKQVGRMKKLRRDYKKGVKEISHVMKRYINSGFQDSEDFFRTLQTLKNASECSSPPLNDLADRYADLRKSLTKELNSAVVSMKYSISNIKCYDDIIDVMNSLDQHLKCALKDHVIDADLSFSSGDYLKEWRDEKQQMDCEMEFDGKDAEEKLRQWKHLMDGLDPSNNFFVRGFHVVTSGTSYRQKVNKIERIISNRSSRGIKALRDGNYILLDECIRILGLIDDNLNKHVAHAGEHCRKLQQDAKDRFLATCDRAQHVLQSEKRSQFESMFADYRGCILHVPCVMANKECQKAFSLTNQLVHDALESDIKNVTKMLGEYAFDIVHKEIIRARNFGHFVADHCTVLKGEIRRCNHVKSDDEWLQKIFDICHEHYSSGRVFGSIKDFVILELPPSADKAAVKKAYKRLAKKYHPDKSGSAETNELFRSIAEAKERLLNKVPSKSESELPFGALIKSIGGSLRQTVKTFLDEQRYDRIKRILFVIKDLKFLRSLVSPNLNHSEIIEEIHKIVASHVQQVKTTVKSNWSSRNYKALNDTITDLRMMEENLKSYNNIFPSSWDDGIVRSVEKEIETLGTRARKFLSTNKSAKQNLDDFRRCFLDMGHVLVELPLFKEFTKTIMSNVLEACLQFEWGYSFLFEFGLGLQRGNENGNEDDNNVAQILVAEFSHFKEVLTMVWNEETSQKPAEDTVHGIKAERRVGGVRSDLDLDKARLLESFRKFEGEYKKLLGEFISPEADIKTLVHRTVTLAEKLQPLDSACGWDEKVKKQIPCILSGVFTVFTVLKSGASYNRLESTSGSTSEKLLMKPHNIQVLTLLSLFGCGASDSNSTSLSSQLMQIRTGEGKSMILGAAAVVLALLGFRVRCVCYSEYLSARDFNLFQDIFDVFNVTNFVKYSKITTLSEDTTAAKGDIRKLTDALLRRKLLEFPIATRQSNYPYSDQLNNATSSLEGNKATDGIVNTKQQASIQQSKKSPKRRKTNKGKTSSKIVSKKSPKRRKTNKGKASSEIVSETDDNLSKGHGASSRKEILLVDEVDVFFGGDFYGRTYNQVAQFREPEIVSILNHIWIVNKRDGRRQRLADIQALPFYRRLVEKMPPFKFLIDAEISLMIDQVRKVDEEQYYLDPETDRIGYKVMDCISYEATYGYRTVFAYMQEAERGNLRREDETLKRALAMPISCGQFSYAEISPERILGVSGTLSALGEFEYNVLSKYGVDTFMYVPSVYGESNFEFDKAGNGIYIDTSKSDYFHSITDHIRESTKQKRAVIVFFENNSRLREFTNSAFYRKLSRQKKLLTEDLNKGDKEFVISKAATAGQITIATAVFGRGTDFFCKDETVQKNGGVHVIQTFLSEEQSEEIQIQGRTARQGKKGSYEMILLASDLEEKYGVPKGMKDNVAKENWYRELCSARKKLLDKYHTTIDENLIDATKKDQATHLYFDSLLSRNEVEATAKFKDLYNSFKKGDMPSTIQLDIAFLVDLTGSMAPYSPSIVKTVDVMLRGSGSITEKLKTNFPDIEFSLRIGIMGYRDIEDGSQFIESQYSGVSHFTDGIDTAISYLESISQNPSGGGDLAEDHLGAIDRASKWNNTDDWTSPIKFMLLLTDAPAHGMVPKGSKGVTNVDNYSVRHPSGITGKSVVESLLRNDIDLFFCSFNPQATLLTEQTLSTLLMNHADNTEQREIISIPMVPNNHQLVPAQHSGRAEVLGGYGQHIVFVLDMSGSMSHDWSGVVAAYNQYLQRRRQSQSECDLISVVQFDCSAKITVDMASIGQAPNTLQFRGGGTNFSPAAQSASALVLKTPSTHTPIVVFMSDGEAYDTHGAVKVFSQLNNNIQNTKGSDLEFHVIAFGSGASTAQLQQIAGSSRNGKLYTSADTAQLSNIFVEIAGGDNVAAMLETEIGKRISDAVSDKLSLEYLA